MTKQDIARAAYERARDTGFTSNPYIITSTNWFLHELGIYFFRTGKTVPVNAKMSRGYSCKANNMLFKIHYTKESVKFERIA